MPIKAKTLVFFYIYLHVDWFKMNVTQHLFMFLGKYADLCICKTSKNLLGVL